MVCCGHDSRLTELVEDLQQTLSPGDLTDLARVLHDSYAGIKSDWELWPIILAAFPTELLPRLRELQRDVLAHEVLNAVVMRYYPGERVLKYHLVRDHLHRPDEVGLIEMNVGRSRLDFGYVNGSSFAFEIKTELDTTQKLAKQVEDYSSVFEHVTVLAHERHARATWDMVPSYCGIISFELVDGEVVCTPIRQPAKSLTLRPDVQVRCLSSADIAYALRLAGVSPIPTTRADREASLLSACTNDEINELFKLAIKHKFEGRWIHLKGVFDRILPIDIQLFFNANLDPVWVYYKNSSMV